MKTKSDYALLVLAFVMLFNPNITVIDLLPDFVAWFILARLFDRAADAAPHFEEARAGFVRLGIISILRIPVFALILFVKGKDPTDNNIITLATFTMAAIEGVLTVMAAKNTFLALFHLGERSDVASLIKPFKSPITKRTVSTDAYKEYTYFFFICKALLYALPDMFLLTRVTDAGYVTSFSPYYPPAILISQILGFTLGTVWLIRSVGYARAITDENKFNDALFSVARDGSIDAYERKRRIRKTSTLLIAFAISTVFTLVVSFDDFRGIDILPCFIFGIVASICIFRLRSQVPSFKPAFITGLLYSFVAAVDYVLSVIFLSRYKYADITRNVLAEKAYLPVQIAGVMHLASFIIFAVCVALFFKAFILNHTGLSPVSERYGKMETAYHESLIQRSYRLCGIGILAAAARCANVFINAYVSFSYTYKDDVPSLTVPVSVAPWFNIVIAALSLLYVGYSLYFFSTLKDEVKMKYL